MVLFRTIFFNALETGSGSKTSFHMLLLGLSSLELPLYAGFGICLYLHFCYAGSWLVYFVKPELVTRFAVNSTDFDGYLRNAFHSGRTEKRTGSLSLEKR